MCCTTARCAQGWCWSRRQAWARSSAVLSNNPQAEVTAFEKDLLTGKMLGHLYPQQKIRTEGFEKIEKPFLNRFDLAISNILGDIAVFDAEYEKSRSCTG